MKKIASAAVAAFIIAVASPAAAQTVTDEYIYGDAQVTSGGYLLTSDPASATPYSGLVFGFAPGFTLSQLTQLSASYQLTDGSFGNGAPRFSLFDDTSNAANGAYLYFTGAPTGSTGNYADLSDLTVRVECNGFANCTTTYPGTTFADFVSQAGSTGISYITLDVDGGYVDRQQLLVTDFSVNGNSFGASPAAVPEPATWAMMLIGFGGIGFQMRRQRRQMIPQAA